jgi:hypothetical protein
MTEGAMADLHDRHSAQAMIVGGNIVIQIPIKNLPMIVEGGWLCSVYDTRLKVTDAAVFAKELVRELNAEDEDGTTRIHKMFDAAIDEAANQGAQGIAEHEDQEGP